MKPDTFIAWFVEPAVVLAGTGLFVRLVLWPALKSLMRTDLEPELTMLKGHDVAIIAARLDIEANKESLAELAKIPELLGRIDEKVSMLMKMSDRRKDPRD